jgi:ketosteroid isomerase-like protein
VDEAANRQTIQNLIDAINSRRLDLFHQQFAEEAVMEYPQSGERIVGDANRRALYAAMPSLPSLKPRRIIATGDMVVAELDYHSSNDYLAVFMFRLRDGKIIYQIAYWTEPFPAPEWRSQWVEHK